MKKFMALPLAAMLLCLCACTSGAGSGNAEVPQITMQDIVDANTRSAVFSTHTSVSWQDSGLSPYYYYATPEYDYAEYFDYSYLAADDELYFLLDGEEGRDVLALRWFAMSEEEAAEHDYVDPEYLIVDLEGTPSEEIVDVKENTDGTIDVTTLAGSDAVAAMLDSDLYPDLEAEDDAVVKNIYTVDAETLLLLGGQAFLVSGDNETEVNKGVASYDEDYPAALQDAIEKRDAFKAATEENPQTITAIYDPGTEKEEQYSITFGKGQNVDVVPKDGYDAYLDQDKNEPVELPMVLQEGTVYLYPSE